MDSAPRVEDLGDLDGDVLLFGGPCSNLQATLALLAEARKARIPPGRRICTGDAVAYCANPAETVRALDGQCAWLAGNVEQQLAAGADDCGCGFAAGSACDRLSHGWFAHASAELGPEARARMGACPDIILFANRGRRYAVVHGGARVINRFLWPSDRSEVLAAEIGMLRRLVGSVDGVVAGHCGVAFHRHIDGVDWINAGAIGIPPDDGRQQTRFAVLTDQGVMIERLSYDVAGAVAAMRAASLTQGYDRALETGRWPSQEILPAEMRL